MGGVDGGLNDGDAASGASVHFLPALFRHGTDDVGHKGVTPEETIDILLLETLE